MKKLLFVTKDKRYWDQISMRRSDPRFFLMPAHDIGSARLFLESTRFDLILVDIAGSSLDEFGLIGSVLAAPHQSPPLAVVSGAHSGSPRLTHGMGVLVTSRSDLSLRDCEATLTAYDTLLRSHEPHGNGVHDLVELAGLESRTFALGVRSGERKGWIFIEQGQTIDASDGLSCRPGLADHLDDWPEIRFRVFPFSQTALASARDALQLPPGSLDTGVFTVVNPVQFSQEERVAEVEAAPAAEMAEATGPIPSGLPPQREEPIGDGEATLTVEGLIELLQAEVPTVTAAILADAQGEVLNLIGHLRDADRGNLAAAVHLLFSGGRRVLANLSILEYQCLTLEAESAVIACWPLGGGLLAVIAGDPRSLGKIRLVVKRILPDLARCLAAGSAAP